MELLEAAPVAREWAAAPDRRPPPGLVGVHLEQDHGVPGERLAHPLGADGAAAEGDHVRAVGAQRRARTAALEQLEHHLFLARAKGGLPLAVEERLDRLSQPRLELAVGVAGLHPQRGRERARAGRLPGAHEAHEHEGASARYPRLQPIRSS